MRKTMINYVRQMIRKIYFDEFEFTLRSISKEMAEINKSCENLREQNVAMLERIAHVEASIKTQIPDEIVISDLRALENRLRVVHAKSH